MCESNTICKIKKLKADVFFNFCSISKTKIDINNANISVAIPKECFFIDNSSKVSFKNINLKSKYNPIFAKLIDNKAISYLSGNSKLFIDSLNLDIQVSNHMYFLRSDGGSNFELNNINISGLYNFLYIGNFVSGCISNSNVNTKSIMFSMYQNSNLNIENTDLTNAGNFKFITEDNSNLTLTNVNVNGGQFVSMSKNSQLYMTNSLIKANDQCCKMQGNTYFEDTFSKWQIDSYNSNNNAFYLLDRATLTMNLSSINIEGIFVYCLDNSSLKFNNTDILSETNTNMFLLADRSRAEIISSKLDVYSVAKLKNYSNIIIKK